MRIGLSAKKVDREEAEKSVEIGVKSKYEKDWALIVERLIKALRDENRYVRWGAAGALGELGDERAMEPLIQALKDKEIIVRNRVAWALGKIDQKAVFDSLTKILRNYEISEVQERVELNIDE